MPSSHTIHRQNHHFGWNNTNVPVLRVAPGETVTFDTVDSSGGQLSGTWSEAQHQLQGDVTGSVTPGNIRASAKSPAFEASVNVRTTGSNQAITIQAPGTAISDVAIALKR